jgi:hypothetical protein
VILVSLACVPDLGVHEELDVAGLEVHGDQKSDPSSTTLTNASADSSPNSSAKPSPNPQSARHGQRLSAVVRGPCLEIRDPPCDGEASST